MSVVDKTGILWSDVEVVMQSVRSLPVRYHGCLHSLVLNHFYNRFKMSLPPLPLSSANYAFRLLPLGLPSLLLIALLPLLLLRSIQFCLFCLLPRFKSLHFREFGVCLAGLLIKGVNTPFTNIILVADELPDCKDFLTHSIPDSLLGCLPRSSTKL